MRLLTILCAMCIAVPSFAGPIAEREGWAIHSTNKTYGALVDSVKSAAKANGLGVVTQAGPTGAAKRRGITIPGNRVIGLFNNEFAVDILNLSTAAMIEAPVRVYVTENKDGTGTLSYKLPSFVFSPYIDDGGPALADLAAELDAKFADVARDAIQ